MDTKLFCSPESILRISKTADSRISTIVSSLLLLRSVLASLRPSLRTHATARSERSAIASNSNGVDNHVGSPTPGYASICISSSFLDLNICSALIPFVTGKPIRKLPKELQIDPNAPTQEIYTSLAEASGFSIHRLRITKGSDRTVVPNSKGMTANDIGLRDQSVVHVKDLGMLEP